MQTSSVEFVGRNYTERRVGNVRELTRTTGLDITMSELRS